MPSAPLPPGATVIAYARDSGGQSQDRSVAQQLAAIRAYSQQHSLVMVREFVDEAAPGSSTVGRDAFQDMVAWLRKLAPEPEQRKPRSPEAPAGVIYWDLRRFGRDQDDSAYYRADLRRRGYVLISLADDVPAGDLAPVVESLLTWKAEQDLRDLSRDVKRGLRALVLRRGPDGQYLHAWTGRIPPGFRRIQVEAGTKRDGTPRLVQGLEPDRGGSWERVRQAFELRAHGVSLQRIHELTRLGKRRRVYYDLFRNPIYTGRLEYGGEVVEGWIEPCVCTATWEQVQGVNQNHRAPPRLGTSSYTLSGWFRCGECGRGLTGKTNRLRQGDRRYLYRRYACSLARNGWDACPHRRLLDADRLEAAVYRVLAEQVLKPDLLMELLSSQPEDPARAQHAAEVARLEADLDSLDRIVARLVDAIEQGGKMPALVARLDKRQAERGILQARLAKARRDLDAAQADPVPLEVVRAFCEEIAQVLALGEPATVRDVLGLVLVEGLVWEDGRGELAWRSPWSGASGRVAFEW